MFGIFDGISDHYFTGADVLIEGTKVAAVETSPIAEDPNTVVIDGADRVLVPGMSDAHVHLFGVAKHALRHDAGVPIPLDRKHTRPRRRCCAD